MSTGFDTNMVAALVRASDAASQQYQDRPCENCGADASRPYVFQYARTLSKQSRTVGDTTTTTTSFGDVSARAAGLCSGCVDQHRRKISRQFQRGLIVAGPITLIGLVFGLTTPDSDLREIALVVALMAGIVVIVSIYQLWSYRDEDNVGRRKALALHQPALEEQGYDSFWAQFSLDELKERLAREQG